MKQKIEFIRGDYPCGLDITCSYNFKFPMNTSFAGDFDMMDSDLQELSPNLSVGGSLDARGSQLRSLPKGLIVLANLDLENTLLFPHEYLDDSIYVQGLIYQ